MMDQSDSVIVKAAQAVGIRTLQGIFLAAIAGGTLLPLWLLWSIFH